MTSTCMRGLVYALLALVALCGGCERTKRADVPAARATSAESAPLPAKDVGPETPPRECGEVVRWRFEAKGRVVALGDVHGDMAALRRILRASALIDEGDHWVAGDAVLVQVGDVLDRGDDELEILEWLAVLEREARRAGGQVVVLNGNHELMNVAWDFRYVTAGGWEDFSEQTVPDALAAALADVPVQQRGRAAAFAPGGHWASRFAQQPIVVVVGDTVFAHAGVKRQHVGAIADMHRELQCWLRGVAPPPGRVLAAEDSPVWTRDYAMSSPPCDELAQVLASLGASRMVVGHTVQPALEITSACENTLWRIDVGMSAYYGGVAAALEIDGQGVRAVRAPADAGR